MYKKHAVSIPQETGKIILAKSGNATYVYFQTDRIYDPAKKYNSAKRTTIGKVCEDNPTMMFPNEKFFQHFPDSPYSEEDSSPKHSCAIRIGNYILIRKVIEDLGLDNVLSQFFEPDDLNLLFDMAAYSIITENNAGQYYPMYAYDHAVFTTGMKVYSDSKISRWLHSVTASQIISSVNAWNCQQNCKDHIYISYDSTNKNSQAGDVSFVEYGAAKVDVGLPIINYSMAYDLTERVPLYYESYPGSIPDVAQLSCMVEKARAYRYKNIGFILDRGYFSEKNIRHIDDNGFSFVIMIKGRKKLIRSIIEAHLHTFEKKSRNYIDAYDVFGCTVESELFKNDCTKRFIHLFHSSSKEAAELNRFNDDLRKMKKEMDKRIGKYTVLPKQYSELFTLYYEDVEVKTKDSHGKPATEVKKEFIAYEENEAVVEQQRNLCGYFAIATSKRMTARDALALYKSRDMSEKLFRGDKSYLGDKSLRTYSTESTETKIFIEFIALIIRSRIYTKLHDFNLSLASKLNYLTVPAAIRELEKIMMVLLPDGKFHQSYAVTKTQRTILSAFGITKDDVGDVAKTISKTLQEDDYGKSEKANA